MDARVFIDRDGRETATGVAAAVPWWSFTKTVLTAALVKLAEQGRIDLDAMVDGAAYTAVQLLRHEAGLPDYGGLARYHEDVQAGRAPWPIEALLEAAEADRLRYEPGQGWAYSNIGYWAVSRLIEAASRTTLVEALPALVFRPAGLRSARLVVDPAGLGDVCMGDAAGYHPGWVYHGLVVGPVPEAARLLRALLRGEIVGQDSLARMLQRRALPQFRSALYPDPAYGLGLMLQATEPLAGPVGHSGSGPGSRIAVYDTGGATCAVWAATSSGVDPEAAVLSALGQTRAQNAG